MPLSYGKELMELGYLEQQYSSMSRKSTTNATFALSVDGEVQRRSEGMALCLYVCGLKVKAHDIGCQEKNCGTA